MAYYSNLYYAGNNNKLKKPGYQTGSTYINQNNN